MNSILTRLRSSPAFARNIGAFVCAATMLLSPAQRVSAAVPPTPDSAKVEKVKTRVEKVKGSATNTITSLVFLDDTTIAIEAEQVGKLTHFGKFTGEFSYLATASAAALVLVGNATLTNHKGEKLFLAATIVELGADYPYTVVGVLTVTGGTGDYAGATGTIAISGEDDTSFTDTFRLDGVLKTVR